MQRYYVNSRDGGCERENVKIMDIVSWKMRRKKIEEQK